MLNESCARPPRSTLRCACMRQPEDYCSEVRSWMRSGAGGPRGCMVPVPVPVSVYARFYRAMSRHSGQRATGQPESLVYCNQPNATRGTDSRTQTPRQRRETPTSRNTACSHGHGSRPRTAERPHDAAPRTSPLRVDLDPTSRRDTHRHWKIVACAQNAITTCSLPWERTALCTPRIDSVMENGTASGCRCLRRTSVDERLLCTVG